MGRVRAGQVDGISSKELFESVRDLSLGLSSLGLRTGDRVAIVSESRPEWILTDLAVTARGAASPCRSIRRFRRRRPATS